MPANPFSVKSPEGLEPKEIASLFVDVYTDFPKLQEVGHTFLHGARGTGKSMMLRFLEPTVQIAAKRSPSIPDLQYYAVHVPIKRANLGITEMERMDGTTKMILGEHMLCIHVASRIFQSLSQICTDEQSVSSDTERFCEEGFLPLFRSTGAAINDDFTLALKRHANPFAFMQSMMDREFTSAIQFLKRHAFSPDRAPYEGALAGFLDFLYPLAEHIKQLLFMPGGPLFLMLDDADNLPVHMQRIVNSWVATRTQDVISLKISTQLHYRTWRTAEGSIISAPHDFTETDIGTIYASKTDHYYDRVHAIAKKRISLLHPDKDIDPVDFFPVDAEEEAAIEEIKRRLRKKHERGEGRGYRPSDDAVRYAVPDYMVSLAGRRKSSATFSYAGFKSLVHLSSGIARWFLDAAALMFSNTLSTSHGRANEIVKISPRVQDKVIFEWSETFLMAELEKLQERDGGDLRPSGRHKKKAADMLGVLINSLGEGFRYRILDSDASERKLFSVVVTGEISREVNEALSLGVRWGYLQKSTIGSKEGIGRRPQYILSRRLAPYFKLDPTGYAGYLPLTAKDLELACHDTREYVKKRLESPASPSEQQGQLKLGD